jgi:hypothetical protein
MLAERLDRFDHARSSEQMTVTLQSLDQTRGWIGLPADRRKEGVAIRTRQNHALMLVENPARPFIGQIAGGKTGDRHGLLDHLFCRWRQAQLESLRFVFPFGRWRFLRGGRHDHSPERFVRQTTVHGNNLSERDDLDGGRRRADRVDAQV